MSSSKPRAREIACQECKEPIEEEQALDTLENLCRALCSGCADEVCEEDEADRRIDAHLERGL